MKKLLTYSLKILGWIILAVIFMVVVSGLALQTKPVKRKLASIAEEQTANFINGNISLGEINGNFFSHLELSNILLTFESDTAMFLPEISAKYNIWSLLKNRVEIHSFEIAQPKLNLEQNPDSSWNLTQLFKPSESDTTSGGTAFTVDLQKFELKEGRISILSSDTLIPKKILNLNTNLTASYSENQQTLILNEFSFQTESPKLEVKRLSFKINRNNKKILLTDFVFQTSLNRISGTGSYEKTKDITAESHLESSPLQVREFSFYLPEIDLPVTPKLDLQTKLENGNLSGSATLQDSGQYIRFDFETPDFTDFLSQPEKINPSYRINTDFKNINLEDWLGKQLKGYALNGNLTLDGMGLDASSARASLKGSLTESSILNHRVESLNLSFNLVNGTIKGFTNLKGTFGKIHLSPEIKQLTTEPEYTAEIRTSHLNLAKLTGFDSLQSDLNLSAQISGRNFEPEQIKAKALVELSPSKVQGIQIDKAKTSFEYNQNNLMIDSLILLTHGLNLQADGNYNLEGSSDINLKAQFDSLGFLSRFVTFKGLEMEGNLTAKLTGTPDSLQIQATANFKNSCYENFSMQDIQLEATGKLNPSDTLIDVQIKAQNLNADGYLLDSVLANISATPDSFFVQSRISNEEINFNFSAGVKLADALKIDLNEWDINYKTQEWALKQPTQILIDSSKYRVNNFSMSSGKQDSVQLLSIDGVLNQTGESKLSFEAKNIDVHSLTQMFLPEPVFSGLFNFSGSLNGNPENPKIEGKYHIINPQINSYPLKTVSGDFNLKDSIFLLGSKIIPRDSSKLNLTGKLPIYVNLDSMSFTYQNSDSVLLNIEVEKFPLAVLQELNISESINGYLLGSVRVTGTVESPVPKGYLNMVDASVRIPEYGIDYFNAGFKTTFGVNSIRLDTLFVNSKDGNLTGTGQVDFKNAVYEGNIKRSEINLKFNKFNPVNHRRLNMQLNGGIQLHGEKGAVVFDGNLTVPQSNIYLPFLMNLTGNAYTPEIPKPVLVSELEKIHAASDSNETGSTIAIQQDTISFDYFKNLTGKLKIKIPRNTWIKNEDMYLELSGDLELRKNTEFTELFGAVDVLRGQYSILGKTFKIDDGTVTFRGGEEFKPEVNITASNTFRSAQKISRKLTVNVSGTASSPAVEFSLDGNTISEGDALSYILFGRSMDELTISQQENISGNSSLAANAAASLLSSQLTKLLGDKLNFDYIEVKSDGSFNNATLVVGKYITNNLFASYEQRFGETNEKNLAKYEVKLEYELFKFLFFQLNNSSNDSGFDVVIKLDSE